MKGKGIIMPQLVYPTLDLFLYDLGESLGQDAHDSGRKRDNFKRKLPAEVASQIDPRLDHEGEYVELLGENRYHSFSEGEDYDGYYYPVKLGDSYGLWLDCSPRQQYQSSENLQWVIDLKQVIEQQLRGETATLGQTWVFYAAVPEVSLTEYETIAQDCYHALMPSTSPYDYGWEEDKIGESAFTGGKWFEYWLPGHSHLVIILFSNREILEEKMPDLIHDEMRLFEYRHKITWAYAQSRTLKKSLKAKAVEIQACREAFQNEEAPLLLLKKANSVLSDYLSLLSGLESQGHTIETNLHNYKKRLVKLQEKMVGLNFPVVFKQEVEEKYLPQIRQDHASLSSSLKLIENVVASVQAQEMHHNVQHIAAVQRKVEWLEVFFVSFYAAEFAHILVELLHQEPPNLLNIGMVMVAAVFGGVAAFVGLHWSKYFKGFIVVTLLVLGGLLLIVFLEEMGLWELIWQYVKRILIDLR
jgi:hypothetical protein